MERKFIRERNKKYAHLLSVKHADEIGTCFLYYKDLPVAFWLKGDKESADRAYKEASALLKAIEIQGLK